MSTRKTPRIKFSRWYPFERIQDLSRIRGMKAPGVYLIGEFGRKPRGRVDRDSEDIIYIGVSIISVHNRLKKFYRTLFMGKSGHAGGKNCREKFKTTNRRKAARLKKQLCVAVFRVETDRMQEKALQRCFIKYVERALLLGYCKKHGRLPC